jgi:APA family basic amino acid/polyamine antiporter
VLGRGLGQPALFAIVYISVASSIYFSLGVVADHALGLTPLVFLVAGLFFALAAMTYVEGASLHPERAGSTVFARYGFNELVSFIAGWAILLDYIILVAVTAFSATNYLAAFWGDLGNSGGTEIILALGIITYVAARNIRGFSKTRVNRISALVIADIGLQLLLIVVGMAVFFEPHVLLDSIHLGTTPGWDDAIFALGVATVVFTGLESAASLSGEVRATRGQLKRLIMSATAVVMVVYVGIALVAMTAFPVTGNTTGLSRHVDAPVLGIAEAFHDRWVSDFFKYTVAVAATATLIAAANSAMLGLSRLAYTLARNRQIPSALGRLHPTRSTPFVLIGMAAVIAGALVVPADLDFLVGIYAFGALIGLTIAHLSIIALRYREPDRERFYSVPLSVPFRGGSLPLPAVLGALLSSLAWVSVVITHSGARYVGFGWMAFGLVTYVGYRRTQGKSLVKRVQVPEAALKMEREELEFGSILVPLTGTPLDDDMIQTAGRLAGQETDPGLEHPESTIEALWIFEVPMALPIDARLPDAQLEHARASLRRAKAVGEEYDGVEVATATVRARRAGAAIVDEARRRGVQAIVLAAEEPSRIRGGALLGGLAGARDNFVGDATKYVVSKAPCEVILTAPRSSDAPARPLREPVEPAAAAPEPRDESISAAPPLREK